MGLARTAGWSSLGVWEATRRVEIISHRVIFHSACGNLLAEWRFPTHRRAFSALSAGGHRQVRVDFDDGDNQKCTLLPGSWEFE